MTNLNGIKQNIYILLQVENNNMLIKKHIIMKVVYKWIIFR